MNAIQFSYAIDLYVNRTHSSRFYNVEKNKAVNDAMMKKIDSITDTYNPNKLTGIDRIQKFRDELYTLIKTSTTPATNIGLYNDDITIDHINYPSDYQTFTALTVTIDGKTTYSRDNMNYNTRGPQLECSFRKPNNKKPFFLEDATGVLVYRGIGSTITSPKLDYIKQPVDFNMGTESQYINAGNGVLVNATSYIAVEVSVHNGITYQEGTQFVSSNANLTSGKVILTSNTTTCELPEKCHDEIAKMAAEILLGVTKDFEGSAFTEKETK